MRLTIVSPGSRRSAALLFALIVLVGALVGGAFQTPAAAAPVPGVNAQDQAFLRGAHQAHLAAVAAARIAIRKGTEKSTRDLANRWLTDHSTLDNALRPVAKKLGVELPARPDATQQAMLSRYEQTTGSAFDGLWITTQRQAQASVRRLVEAELTGGQSGEVKRLARQTSPVIAQHAQVLDDSAPGVGAAPGQVDGGRGISSGNRPLIAGTLAAVGLAFVLGSAAWLWRRATDKATGQSAG
jgi:putative membrane protein